MVDILSYAGPALIILGALLTALNLGARVTGWGFVALTIGSVVWVALGVIEGEPGVIWQNVVLAALDAFGIWRWLGREAAHEEGASLAQKRSERRDGPDLFPASMFAGAPVRFGDGEGRAVDAMLDCGRGVPAYVVVAVGGVAGVGETLRRVEWDALIIDGDALGTTARIDEFAELKSDAWPGR